MSKEKGFSLVEGLLIVLIVAFVGFTGWYVFNRQDESNENNSAKQQATTQEQSPANNSTSIVMTSHNNKFTIVVPDGWTITNDTELDYAHAIGIKNMTTKPGTPATIVSELGLRGEGPTTTSFIMQHGATLELSEYYANSKSVDEFETTTGLKVQKFILAENSYGYQITSGDDTVIANYMLIPGDPDQLESVETAIKSIQIL